MMTFMKFLLMSAVASLACGAVPAAAQARSMELETVVTLPSTGPTENLSQASDGSIYITGLDDRVLYRVSNGRLETLARFSAYAALVGVAAGPGELVLTVCKKPYRNATGAFDLTDVGTEVMVLDAKGTIKATVPGEKGHSFNGVAVTGDRTYYIADTNANMLWRFHSGTMRLEEWLRDVPGANGIKVLNGWVYVSTSAGIQRVQIAADGKPGPLTMFSEGTRADDFAIAPDGSLYIPRGTTLTKVTPTGQASALMENVSGGAAAIVSNDGRWVYWATSGGNQPQRLVRVPVQ